MRQRVIIAFSLMLPSLVLIWLGGVFFSAAWTATMLVASWEYCKLSEHIQLPAPKGLLLAGVALFGIGVQFWGVESLALVAGINLVMVSAWFLWQYEHAQTTTHGTFFGRWGVTLAGIFYLGMCGATIIAIRNLSGGFWWLLVLLPANWMADSAALFTGRAIGKHKLSPHLSPKKTWEGYLGGIISTPLVAILWAWIWNTASAHWGWLEPTPAGFTAGNLFWMGLLLAITGTMGDLTISMLKRDAHVKDTGTVLAAHGGILDRVDSWLPTAIIFYWCLHYLIK